jgi:hypothetical protein
MRAQRKQIGPKLIMQLARNFLAFDILQRDDALGQTPLVVNRIAQSGRKVIQLVADRGEFRRAIRFHARVVATGLDLRHRLRKRLDRRQRPADDPGIVMRKRTMAIAVPIWSWVTIPSQISAISSFGCDVISSDPAFP